MGCCSSKPVADSIGVSEDEYFEQNSIVSKNKQMNKSHENRDRTLNSFFVTEQSSFGDLVINWTGDLNDSDHLMSFINSNMGEWLNKDVPSLWIHLKGKDLKFLTDIISNGFDIHRCEKENVIVLNKWIRSYAKTLPVQPFSYIGVGAMCVNDKGKVLCVRENYKTGPGPWKLPGGLFDTDKDKVFGDTAVRELKEETGITSVYEYILCQRFAFHGFIFGAPDLYVVCVCSPLEGELNIDPVEVAECQWIDLDELASSPYKLFGEVVRLYRSGKKLCKELPLNELADSLILSPQT